MWRKGRRVWPGLALSAVLALAATSVSILHGGPQLLYALLFGMAFHYLSGEPRTKPGIEFCTRFVLRLGVGLLGARITVEQIAGLGWQTALTVCAAIVSTLLFALFVGRKFGMTRAQRVLSGGAVAICGASAALAISAVLPRERDGERFTLMVVVCVTVLSTVAMVVYPLLARALDLPPALAGLFLGATIHDVAQVVGAGYILGPTTGDVATIVKLFRVSLLAAVVVVVTLAFRREREAARDVDADRPTPARQPLVPWFLWVFIALVALNSAGMLASTSLHVALNDAARACLVTAIAALGTKTSFAQLAKAGVGPLLLIGAETLWIACFVLLIVLLAA